MTDPRLDRIAAINDMFTAASCWGTWMVSAANERESQVNALRAEGRDIEHGWLARTSGGGKVS